MDVKDTITLERTGFLVTGIAYLTLWGGEKAIIDMKPYEVTSIDEKLIANNLNDNGFGVASIDGADCDIFKIYGDKYLLPIGHMDFRDGKCVRSKMYEEAV